jgi:hypothetical protein
MRFQKSGICNQQGNLMACHQNPMDKARAIFQQNPMKIIENPYVS